MNKERSFSKLYHDVADSQAWQSLSSHAQRAYFNLLFVYKGQTWFKCLREELKCRQSPWGFSTGIQELEKVGFITVRRFKPYTKKPNMYRFVLGWKRWKP